MYKNNKSLFTQAVIMQELPKYQPAQNPTYQIDSLKKEINQKTVWQSRLSSRQSFVPCIKLSKSQTFLLDGVEIGILLSGFAEQFRCKNADVPDLYFILLDAAGISLTLVRNRNAKTKERRSCVPSKKGTSGASKVIHTRRCCLWVCTQLSES